MDFDGLTRHYHSLPLHDLKNCLSFANDVLKALNMHKRIVFEDGRFEAADTGGIMGSGLGAVGGLGDGAGGSGVRVGAGEVGVTGVMMGTSSPVQGGRWPFYPGWGGSGPSSPVQGGSGPFYPVRGGSGPSSPVRGGRWPFYPDWGGSRPSSPVQGGSGPSFHAQGMASLLPPFGVRAGELGMGVGLTPPTGMGVDPLFCPGVGLLPPGGDGPFPSFGSAGWGPPFPGGRPFSSFGNAGWGHPFPLIGGGGVLGGIEGQDDGIGELQEELNGVRGQLVQCENAIRDLEGTEKNAKVAVYIREYPNWVHFLAVVRTLVQSFPLVTKPLEISKLKEQVDEYIRTEFGLRERDGISFTIHDAHNVVRVINSIRAHLNMEDRRYVMEVFGDPDSCYLLGKEDHAVEQLNEVRKSLNEKRQQKDEFLKAIRNIHAKINRKRKRLLQQQH